MLTREEADKIHDGENGHEKSRHFASPYARDIVINGLAIYSHSMTQSDHNSVSGTPITIHDVKGRGGGSFCNHSDNPNAKLERSSCGDGRGLFVVALRDIQKGEFITVDYGKSFLESKWSNLKQIAK